VILSEILIVKRTDFANKKMTAKFETLAAVWAIFIFF